MTRAFLRYRRTLVLSSALVLSFVLMTLQVRSRSTVTDLTRRALLTSVTPFLQIVAIGKAGTLALWNEYIDLRRVRRENHRLRQEVQSLRLQVGELQEIALEHARLRQFLDLKSRVGAEALVARVIGKDATNWFRTVLIDKGTSAGVQRRMPVVTGEGLVGRVVDVAAFAARIQLVTDPESAVGCLIQRTRVTGVATGTQAGALQIKYIPQMADVAVGDRVLTSGMGGIFPKGIPLGKVVRTSRPNGALFQETEVQPVVNFSRLEEVMVVTQPPGHELAWGAGEQVP